MAIFGTMEVIENQLCDNKFGEAIKYLKKALKPGTLENERLMNLPIGAFEKVEIDDNNFALEQIYHSKEREKCFFESHKQYIDVQCIIEGEEIIEVVNSKSLVVSHSYVQDIDLIKYNKSEEATRLLLKQGDIAIFFPDDAHMPCVKVANTVKVVKTVVKVKV